jgi:hypothetical protein
MNVSIHAKIRQILLITVIICLTWIYPQISIQALMALPDIGIDYQSMTVKEVGKIRAVGMRRAVNGDQVTMSLSKEGVMIFKNERTSESLTYPLQKQQ